MTSTQYHVPIDGCVPFSPVEVYDSSNGTLSSVLNQSLSESAIDMSQRALLLPESPSPLRYYGSEFGARKQAQMVLTSANLPRNACAVSLGQDTAWGNPFKDCLNSSPKPFSHSTSTLVVDMNDDAKICGTPPIISIVPPAQPHMTAVRFNVIRRVGSGTSGDVYSVTSTKMLGGRDVFASGYLALKVIRKSQHRTDVHRLLREQRALQRSVGCNFVLQLRASFHDSENFYLITDFHLPGDLEAEIIRCGRLPCARIQFYAAEILLGLQHLHGLGIIHRDIKPSNVLLSRAGHIAIADLGLARVFDIDGSGTISPFDDSPDLSTNINIGCYGDGEDSTLPREGKRYYTNTPCGSANYMAPEIFRSLQHSFEIDFWSLGITMYDMATGRVPWHHPQVPVLCEMIVNEPLSFDECDETGQIIDVNKVLKDFLNCILKKDPQERLLADAMKKHPFFAEIDWMKAEANAIPVPYIPPHPGWNLGEEESSPSAPIDIHPGELYDDVIDPYPGYTYRRASLWASKDEVQFPGPNANIISLESPISSPSPFASPQRHHPFSTFEFVGVRRMWRKVHLPRPHLGIRQSSSCAPKLHYPDENEAPHYNAIATIHVDRPLPPLPFDVGRSLQKVFHVPGSQGLKRPHVRRWIRRVCSRVSTVDSESKTSSREY